MQTFGAVLDILQNAMKGAGEAKAKDAKPAVVPAPALKSSRCVLPVVPGRVRFQPVT